MGEHSAELAKVQSPPQWVTDPAHPDIERWWNGVEYTEARWRQPVPVLPVHVVATYQTHPITVLVAWTVAILTLGYMLPWAIAATRSLPNHAAIGLVAFLTGWTGIGWIIALAMSASQKHP